MDADERRLDPQIVSAFVGVRQRPKIHVNSTFMNNPGFESEKVRVAPATRESAVADATGIPRLP